MVNRLFFILILIALMGVIAPRAYSQDLEQVAVQTAPLQESFLRYQKNIPGDSKPARVDADEIVYWSDKTKYYLILKGHVLLEQGVLQLRADRSVLIADLETFRQRGIWDLEVYLDGNVKLDNSSEIRLAKEGFVSLSTRGEFKFNAVKAKAEQKDGSADPLFAKAQDAKAKSLKKGEQEKKEPSNKENKKTTWKGSASEGFAGVVERVAFQVPDSPPPAISVMPPPGASIPSGNVPPVALPVAPPIGLPGMPLSIPDAPQRQYTVTPRGASGFNIRMENLGNGETAIMVIGGVVLNVMDVQGIGMLDIEADRLVIWAKGANPQEILGNIRKQSSQNGKDLEFYLSGHVEMRQKDPVKQKKGKVEESQSRVIRADEIYYDIGRNTAIAMNSEMEFYQPKIPDPVFVRASEIQQLAANQYKVVKAEVFSSRLPSDPGLKVYMAEATIEERVVPKFSIFGKRFVDRTTGEELDQKESYVRGKNMFIELENFPVFYLPYLQGDARDPLGPIEGMNLGFNNIFGGQFGLTLNTFDLLGIQPFENTRWRLNLDYLTKRGPGIGTDFDYMAPDFFGIPGRVDGVFKAYGIRDDGLDVLGGNRQEGEPHPLYRGRLLWRQTNSNLPRGFTFLGQASAISDRNFIEQFFKPEWDNDYNQTTFGYLRQMDQNMGWDVFAEPRIRPWINEGEWLPKADGFILGQPIFNIFTNSTWAGVGYGRLLLTNDGTPMVSPTDVADSTGRFNISEELSLPFSLGDLRLAPYLKGDLAYYTSSIIPSAPGVPGMATGDGLGRAWGGGGIRASLPFTASYPEFQSDLFNVNGLNHKIIYGANYYYAASSADYTNFPQLDRLNDDASDQALRDIRNQPNIYPNQNNGALLTTSPLYDPQTYAIRRAIDTRIDTLQAIDVLQLDIRQRFQTKRGFPGSQHIVDWMTLDLSGSLFPQRNRDNFGNYLAFLQYDYIWNVGDRTTLASTGWIDPFDNGAKVFTLGAYLNRPDRTNFYLGYRQIEPVESRMLSGAVTYIFSPKYAVTAASAYDFSTFQSLSNSLVLTRVGTDLQVSLGLTYNAMQNNFGFTFEILPTIVSNSGKYLGPISTFGNGGVLTR